MAWESGWEEERSLQRMIEEAKRLNIREISRLQDQEVVRLEVEEAVRLQIDEGVRQQFQEAVSQQIHEAVRLQLEEAVRQQIQGAVRLHIESAVRQQVDETMRLQIQEGVSLQFQEAVRLQVQEALCLRQEDTDRAVEEAVRHHVKAARLQDGPVQSWMHEAVRVQVRAALRLQEQEAERRALEAERVRVEERLRMHEQQYWRGAEEARRVGMEMHLAPRGEKVIWKSARVDDENALEVFKLELAVRGRDAVIRDLRAAVDERVRQVEERMVAAEGQVRRLARGRGARATDGDASGESEGEWTLVDNADAAAADQDEAMPGVEEAMCCSSSEMMGIEEAKGHNAPRNHDAFKETSQGVSPSERTAAQRPPAAIAPDVSSPSSAAAHLPPAAVAPDVTSFVWTSGPLPPACVAPDLTSPVWISDHLPPATHLPPAAVAPDNTSPVWTSDHLPFAGTAPVETSPLMKLRIRIAKLQKRARQATFPEVKLCKSALFGKVETVRQLLDSKVNVNCLSLHGHSPLISALYFNGWMTGDRERHLVLCLLLERGAEVDAVETHGYSPLHLAAIYESVYGSVPRLIAAGADVNARDLTGCTPLHMAAVHGNTAAAKALLEAGAETTARGWSGQWRDMTPFDVARTLSLRTLLRL